MASVLIYGATGYTGRLACGYASEIGLDIILAGRAESKLKSLASLLSAPYRVFNVDNEHELDGALQGIQILLNIAGPFKRTAKSLIDACLRNKVHYLDTAAELDSYLLAAELDHVARTQNVMLLPGCGGSATMLGCLVGHVLERNIESACSIDLALHVTGSMSRGSAITAAENLSNGCLHRVNGQITAKEANETCEFDFDNGSGQVTCFPVTLPDLVTLWRSTKVGNINTFAFASGDSFPPDLGNLPDGPSQVERDATPYHAAVSITWEDGSVSRAVLHTVNGYTFTAVAAVEAVKRVASGLVRAGFQTSAELFGNDFVQAVKGSYIRDL